MMVEGIPANETFRELYPTVVGEHEEVAVNFGEEMFTVDMVTVESAGQELQVDVLSVKPAKKNAKRTVLNAK